MTGPYTVGDPPPGCTCGAYLSIIPPGPCPHHAPHGWVLMPLYPPHTTRWYPPTSTISTITVSSTTNTTLGVTND